MRDRLEIVYQAADELAQAILHGQIALGTLEPDPNRPGEFCSWPETYLAWKESVKKREAEAGRHPLTELQWNIIEQYLVSQYGFTPLKRETK